MTDDAAVRIPCRELSDSLAFYVDDLGFVVRTIFPADAPRFAVIEGHGLRLRLEVTEDERSHDPGIELVFEGDVPAQRSAVAPEGTRLRWLARPGDEVPSSTLSPTFARADDGAWGVGRAGMRYRDLIPDRAGGAFIASHIQILEEGPVPDYVHFHRVHFQVIFCARGWVEVVYEDQGPPFVMVAGDCVLQPPEIRHRVLRASAGLEVVEVSCPAAHPTHGDPELTLPTAEVRAERRWSGQHFVRHVAADATWTARGAWEASVTGLSSAAGGAVGVTVFRARAGESAAAPLQLERRHELSLLFVLDGSVSLGTGERGDAPRELTIGDALSVPAGGVLECVAGAAGAHVLWIEGETPHPPDGAP